jgi:hypothetical protein
MKKIYRVSNSKFGILIYATPVDKNAMFLIIAPSVDHAEIYKHLLDFGALDDPLLSPHLYEKIGLHRDGTTPMYELKWSNLQLKLLPQRYVDLNQALVLENFFSKKFENLFLNMDKKSEFINDIQFHFSQLQLGLEYQKFGIGDPLLVAWFADLNKSKVSV